MNPHFFTAPFLHGEIRHQTERLGDDRGLRSEVRLREDTLVRNLEI